MDKIILFDLDGTLIDSTQAVYEAFCESFLHFNQPKPDYKTLCAQIGYTLEDIFATLGVESTEIPQYIAVYKEHYRKICNQKTTLLPNAKEAILKAHTIAHLGVVTTKTGQYSKMLLEHLGVLQYFSCVVGREDVINAKPNAEPILKALKSLPKLSKQTIYMIGDTPLDIQAADNAGVKSIAVLSGYAQLQTLQNYTQNITEDALKAVLLIEANTL